MLQPPIFTTTFAAVFFLCGTAMAALVPTSFTGTPEGSWRYSELLNAGHGESTTYFPTTLAEFQSAVFQGYVTYNAGVPASYWFGQGFDSMQVFSTFLQSSANLTLPVLLGGDDGHSLFVNGVFIGGGGYGDAGVPYTFNLPAGVPVLVQVVGYNGPGPWAFSLLTGNNDTVLEQVPGLRLNADGIFASVPEPMSATVWTILGLGMLTKVATRKPLRGASGSTAMRPPDRGTVEIRQTPC